MVWAHSPTVFLWLGVVTIELWMFLLIPRMKDVKEIGIKYGGWRWKFSLVQIFVCWEDELEHVWNSMISCSVSTKLCILHGMGVTTPSSTNFMQQLFIMTYTLHSDIKLYILWLPGGAHEQLRGWCIITDISNWRYHWTLDEWHHVCGLLQTFLFQTLVSPPSVWNKP